MHRLILINIGIAIISIKLIAQEPIFLPESSTSTILKYKYYTVSYVEEHEQSEWVAYELTDEDIINGNTKRVNSYRPDIEVVTGTADSYDYKNSGYDRGHLAPAGDMKRSREAMFESFLFSNMSPQVAEFNQGIWNFLEMRVRKWAVEKKHIYIITGPVLTSIIDVIGQNEVSVPGYFYKVLLSFEKDEVQSIAFLLPNKRGTMKLPEYVVRIDDLEQITGIDFWSALPDFIENKIEREIVLEDWFSNSELR